MARKGKFSQWLEEESLTLLSGWARDGLSDFQIAKNIGINVATLYEWKKRFSEIDNALKSGKEIADYEVENALYKSALEGNTTAMIFWLKNRRPDKWRDKPVEANKESNEKLDELIDAIRGV